VRKRDLDSAKRRLERRVAKLRSQVNLPSDAELLGLSWKGWSSLEASDADKALLSAFVRARAREDGKKLALLAEMPTTRRKEEQKLIARERVREPTLRRAAEELVGALWDLVPYGADPKRARADKVSPATTRRYEERLVGEAWSRKAVTAWASG